MACSPPGSSVQGIFPRQEDWSWLPFLPQGDLPDPETEIVSLTSPSLVGGLFNTSITWEGPKRKESLVIKKKIYIYMMMSCLPNN